MTSAAFALGASFHAAALTVLVLQACCGARLIRLARLDHGLAMRERLLFGWAAGFAITTSAWMGLVAFGLLGPVAIWSVAFAVAFFAWPEVRWAAAKTWSVLRTADSRTLWGVCLGLLLLAFWAWPLWVETLLPNSDWDSALYHLPLADRYREGLLFARDPYFSAFSFPGAIHLLYAALIDAGLEGAIAPLNFQVTVLCGLTAVSLARHVAGRLAAGWAAVAFASTPILWQLGLDARVDGFLAFSVTLAVYALVRFLQEGRDPYLVLSAVALGAAIGTKYTAWLFVPPVAAIALGFRLWGAAGAKGLPKLIAGCALAIAIPNGAWYAANAVHHGDPLFPILRGDYAERANGERLHLTRADEAVDSSWLDAELRARARQLERSPHEAGPSHLFDFPDLLLHPDRYAVRPNHALGALLLLSLFVPLALPALPERRRAALVVWALGWGSYAVLGGQIPLLRYAAPALPLLAAGTGVVVARIPFRPFHLALGVLALALLARDHAAELSKLDLMKVGVALGGQVSPWRSPERRLSWVKEVGFNFTPPMAYVSEEIARRVASGQIAEDCVIFMVGEGKGRLQPCAFLPDASWFGHRFVSALDGAGRDPARLAAALREAGVTHLLYNDAYYDWVLDETNTHPTRVALLQLHLERLLARHGVLLFEGGGIRFYALRGTP